MAHEANSDMKVFEIDLVTTKMIQEAKSDDFSCQKSG